MKHIIIDEATKWYLKWLKRTLPSPAATLTWHSCINNFNPGLFQIDSFCLQLEKCSMTDTTSGQADYPSIQRNICQNNHNMIVFFSTVCSRSWYNTIIVRFVILGSEELRTVCFSSVKKHINWWRRQSPQLCILHDELCSRSLLSFCVECLPQRCTFGKPCNLEQIEGQGGKPQLQSGNTEGTGHPSSYRNTVHVCLPIDTRGPPHTGGLRWANTCTFLSPSLTPILTWSSHWMIWGSACVSKVLVSVCVWGCAWMEERLESLTDGWGQRELVSLVTGVYRLA